MSWLRAFFSLNLPINLRNQLRTLQKTLVEGATEQSVNVGWVPVANLHLTLHFLGNISNDHIPALRDRITERLGQQKRPITLSVKHLGAFPSKESPRILWIGAKNENGYLETLQSEIAQELELFGLNPETRPFHPHITLGRIRDGACCFWNRWEDADLGQFVAPGITLYHSEIGHDGAHYRPITYFSLPGQ